MLSLKMIFIKACIAWRHSRIKAFIDVGQIETFCVHIIPAVRRNTEPSFLVKEAESMLSETILASNDHRKNHYISKLRKKVIWTFPDHVLLLFCRDPQNANTGGTTSFRGHTKTPTLPGHKQ